jgi:hypothetical protein
MPSTFQNLRDWSFFAVLDVVGLKVPKKLHSFLGGGNSIVSSSLGIEPGTFDPQTEVSFCDRDLALMKFLDPWKQPLTPRADRDIPPLDAELLDIAIPLDHPARGDFFTFGLLGNRV